MRYINVYHGERLRAMAPEFLYELCKEREQENKVNISFRLPSWEQHVAFIERRPYRYWYILQLEGLDAWIGYISATTHNEIGIVLLRQYRGKGFGSEAVRGFTDKFKPLPEIASVRPGRWLANIHPENAPSQRMFTKLGFTLKQQTYEL
ncbi:MAG TPA: GNAT family N-acetyltransferase [Gemmatimonadales bacterium]